MASAMFSKFCVVAYNSTISLAIWKLHIWWEVTP